MKTCAISPQCIMLFANNLKPRVSRLMEHIAATDTHAVFTTKITYGATLTGAITGIIAVRMTVISETKHHTCGAKLETTPAGTTVPKGRPLWQSVEIAAFKSTNVVYMEKVTTGVTLI